MRSHRLPGILLLVVTAVVAFCGIPSAGFFLLAVLKFGPATVPLVLGVPAFLAYAVAVWLYFRSVRPGSAGRAWLLAVLGAILVIGASALPVAIVGGAMYEEWQETQPGGRGYVPPGG